MTAEIRLRDPQLKGLYLEGRRLLREGVEQADFGLLEQAALNFDQVIAEGPELSPRQQGVVGFYATRCYLEITRIRAGIAQADLPGGSDESAMLLAMLAALDVREYHPPVGDSAIIDAFAGTPWLPDVEDALHDLATARTGKSSSASGYFAQARATVLGLLAAGLGTAEAALDGRYDPDDPSVISGERRGLLYLIDARCLVGLLMHSLHQVTNILGADSDAGEEAVSIIQPLAGLA
jgi:hypothetical protein